MVAKAEEREVRRLAASALVDLFVAGGPAVRQAASNALMVVDAPRDARAHRPRREDDNRAPLRALAERFAQNPTR